MPHLISNESYEESEVWCGADRHWNAVRRIEDASCPDCLQALAEAGRKADARIAIVGHAWVEELPRPPTPSPNTAALTEYFVKRFKLVNGL